MIIVTLIQNIAMLVMLATLYQVVEAHGGHGLLRRKALVGLLFGIVAVLGMMAPVGFAPGIIFDGRSIVLSLAGLFGGPVAGLVAAVICGAYRLWLGGGGAAMGVSVTIEAALVGVLFHHLRRRGKWPSDLAGLAAMAWLVHLLMLALTFLLPAEDRPRVWRQLGPAILTVYPAATVLLGMLFLDYERQALARTTLAAGEQRYRTTLASIGDAVIATDNQGRVQFMNPVAEALTGWTAAEAQGQPLETVFVIFNEQTRLPAENPVARVFRTGHVVGLANSTVLRSKDGTERPIADSGAPIRDETGAVHGVVLTFRDQTAERAAQRALSESEEKFRTLAEESLSPVYLIQDGRFRYVNEATARVLGYTRAEILALTSVLEIIAPEDKSRVAENIRRRMSGEVPSLQYEFTVVRKDGKHRLAEAVGSVISYGGRPAIMGTARDVTERRRAEEALRISEARLREAQRVAHVGSWECEVVSADDLSRNRLWWSDETCRLLGFEPQTVEPTHDLFLSRVHPEDRPRVRAAFVEALRTGRPYRIEHRVVLPDGTERVLLEHAEQAEDEPGSTRRIVGAVHDITERHRAVAELQLNHQRYRSAIRAAGAIPYQKDYASDSYVFMGAEIQHLLGYEPAELTSETWKAIILETQMLGAAAGLTPAEARCRALAGQLAEWRADHRVRTRSGEIRWISDIAVPLMSPDGRYLGSLGMIQDITGRKQAEARQRQALERRRLEAEAVACVATSPHLSQGQINELAVQITELASATLGVERAGVWLFNDTTTELVNLDSFVASTGAHTSGDTLLEEAFRNEFAAVKESRYVDAHDALNDPRTAGYVENYLKPHGITSMLDVAIRAEGRVVGLICYEHVGPPRRWEQEDIAFGCQLADQFALALMHRQRPQTLEALRRSEADYREIFNATNEAIFLDDAVTGRIVDVNETMLRMYGYTSKAEVLAGNIGDLSANEPPYTEQEAQRRIRQAIEQGPQTFEWLARKRNGERFWGEVSLRSTAIGGQNRVLAVVRDITARKQAEAALAESEARFRSLYENSLMGLYRTTPDGRILMANPALVRMLGYTSFEELARQNLEQDGFHPEYPRRNFKETVERDGMVMGLESAWTRADGSAVFVRESARAVRDEQGTVLYYDGVVEDITARKQAEAALAESEARYRSLVEQSPDTIGIFQDNRLVYLNTTGARALGASSPDELLGVSGDRFIHPDDRQAVRERIGRLLRGETGLYPAEVRYLRLDGSVVPVEVSAVPVTYQGKPALQFIARDITERKRAEAAHEALLSLGADLSAAQTASDVARSILAAADRLWQWHAGTLDVIWPGETLAQTVLCVDTVNGERREVQPAGSRREPTPTLRRVMAQGPELILRRPDQMHASDGVPFGDTSRLSAALMHVPIRWGGKVLGMLSIQSYTPNAFTPADLRTLQGLADYCGGALERIHAIEHIRRQAALLDASTEAIWVRDLDHRITYWNRGAEQLYGWSPADALGRPFTDLEGLDCAAYQAAHQLLLRDGRWTGELTRTGRSGRATVVLCRWTLLRDAQGQPAEVLGIHTDITEQKQLEANFLRAQRMEGVGALAGGLAHDLNNILAPILMSAPLLRELVHDSEAREMLNTVETCAQRGADIIKQLLTFARGKPGTRLPVPLRQLLREMDKLIAETFPRQIKRRLVAPADLWPVLGDPTQMHQALMNLCVNARDAMPGGGTLTLAAQNVELDEAFADMIPEAKPGPYVCLTVSDTGVGIPPENLTRIFDPFFTTKEVGKGTGLGLATVLGIVRGHGGFLRVQSRVGQGTTFELYLPASPDVREHPSAAAAALPQAGRGELILVVDDEASVRGAVQRSLERNGYRVLLATEGVEALALFAQHRQEVRAVLTDMMMPGMDGPSLVRALRHMAPKLPLLGMTGLAERLGAVDMEALELQAVLTKPFAISALLAELHRVLNPGSQSARAASPAPPPGASDQG